MRINSTRYVILGLLAEEPLSGYDIKKLVDLRFRYFWSESYGQIYPELKKLTTEGLAEPVEPDENSGGRPKKLYRITDAGKAAFAEWMEITPDYEQQRFEFLLKIYWAPWLPASKITEYVRDFMKRHGNDLELLRRMESEVQGMVGDNPDHWWVLQTVRLGRRLNEAYMAWASELLTNMEGLGDHD